MKTFKLLFVLFFIGLSTIVHAQKLGFGIHYGVMDLHNPVMDQEPGATYGAAFTYEKLLNRSWSLVGGIGINVFQVEKKERDLRWPSEHDGMGGFEPDPTLPHQLQMETHYYLLDLRVGGRYYFNQSNVRVFAQPFAEGNIFLTDRSETNLVYDDGTKERFPTLERKEQNVRPINLSLGMAIGVEIPLSQQLHLTIIPTADYQVFNFIKNTSGGSHIIGFYGQLGIQYIL